MENLNLEFPTSSLAQQVQHWLFYFSHYFLFHLSSHVPYQLGTFYLTPSAQIIAARELLHLVEFRGCQSPGGPGVLPELQSLHIVGISSPGESGEFEGWTRWHYSSAGSYYCSHCPIYVSNIFLYTYCISELAFLQSRRRMLHKLSFY